MPDQSKAAVIGAIAANVAVAAAKFAVGIGARSSAILAEGIHSSVDALNDLLLLFGLSRSRQPPDPQHPFGYGKELYFWALIVSMFVLAIGGGVTIYEGILRILHPSAVSGSLWAYLALAAGLLFDGISLVYGFRQFHQQYPGKALWPAIRDAKDPSTFMVITEDTAAILGELIAAAGLFLSTHGMPLADGIASVLIGCLLGTLAIFLIAQTRDLVIGEAAEPAILECIRQSSLGRGKFPRVSNPHTMYFGPDVVLVTMSVAFDPRQPAGELIDAVDRLQISIRKQFPSVKYVYIDPESDQDKDLT